MAKNYSKWQTVVGIPLFLVAIIFYVSNQAAVGSVLLVISIIINTWGVLSGITTKDYWK